MADAAPSGEAGARAVRDVARELRALLKSPPEGIRVLMSAGEEADCLSAVHCEIEGPVGTPYEGGLFRMRLDFGADFPQQPPKGVFLTRVFHPNVSAQGEICVNTLKRDWRPQLGIRHVLLVVRCLLIAPNPESALNEEAGKMLLDDYAQYAHHARLMTSIHAAPKQRQSGGSAGAEQGSAPPVAAPGGLRPLGLNSSIANADGSSEGEGPSQGGGRAALQGGAATGKEKKKVDIRKKALKRL